MNPVSWTTDTTVVHGLRLGWREAGGGPPLLYLHDAGADTLASEVFDDLARDFRVLVPDLPGYGLSDLPAGMGSAVEFADFLAAFLTLLGAAPAVVAGTSIGGWFGAELAAAHPGHVTGLVLANAAGMHAPHGYLFDLFAAGAAAAATNHRVAQALVARLPDEERPGAGTSEEVATAVVAPWVQNLAAAAASSWSPAVADPGMIGRLAAVRCPTVVLWGEGDGLIPLAHGRAYAAAIAGARLQVLAGRGHLVALEDPPAFAAAVRCLEATRGG